MVSKAAVVFIAGGLTGSGIVALTHFMDEMRTSPSGSYITAAVGTAATDWPNTWVAVPQTQNQQAYIQARFAAQRPFAALHPVQR